MCAPNQRPGTLCAPLAGQNIWAVEQAVDQGRSHLARLLSTIYSEAKSDEDRIRSERRKER